MSRYCLRYIKESPGFQVQFPKKPYEETGIRAEEWEFEFLYTERDRNTFYDFYCLKRCVPLENIVLLPGETDAAMWAGYSKVRWMIRAKKICHIIATQYQRQEAALKKRNAPPREEPFF